MAVSRSFHTPDWPLGYLSQDFSCEWVIDIENMTMDTLIEISFNEPYESMVVIHVQLTVEVLDGVEEDSPSLGRHCFLRTPQPILTSSNRAKVVFQGSALSRPASWCFCDMCSKTERYIWLKTVVLLHQIIWFLSFVVDECAVENGCCAHVCQDTSFSYSCSGHEGFILDVDNHNCIGRSFSNIRLELPWLHSIKC